MRSVIYLLAALLACALFLVGLREIRADPSPGNHAGNTTYPPDLEYFESRQPRRSAERPTVALPPHGAVLKPEPAG